MIYAEAYKLKRKNLIIYYKKNLNMDIKVLHSIDFLKKRKKMIYAEA